MVYLICFGKRYRSTRKCGTETSNDWSLTIIFPKTVSFGGCTIPHFYTHTRTHTHTLGLLQNLPQGHWGHWASKSHSRLLACSLNSLRHWWDACYAVGQTSMDVCMYASIQYVHSIEIHALYAMWAIYESCFQTTSLSSIILYYIILYYILYIIYYILYIIYYILYIIYYIKLYYILYYILYIILYIILYYIWY